MSEKPTLDPKEPFKNIMVEKFNKSTAQQ